MDVSTSLLVALMFVTLLSIGIANVIMALGNIVDQYKTIKLHWIPMSWILLLLFIYFNLFWNTLAIFNRDDWMFGGYLYIVSGPILLIFATTVLLEDPGQRGGGMLEGYFEVSRQFFLLMLLLQIWGVGVDVVLGDGFTVGGLFNGISALVVLWLASTQALKAHQLGTVATWLLFVVMMVLRAVGVM